MSVKEVPNVKAPDLLIVRGSNKKIDYSGLYNIVKENCKYYKEKARCIKGEEVELIIEFSSKEKEALLSALNDMNQFTQVNCISHDGECRV